MISLNSPAITSTNCKDKNVKKEASPSTGRSVRRRSKSNSRFGLGPAEEIRSLWAPFETSWGSFEACLGAPFGPVGSPYEVPFASLGPGPLQIVKGR